MLLPRRRRSRAGEVVVDGGNLELGREVRTMPAPTGVRGTSRRRQPPRRQAAIWTTFSRRPLRALQFGAFLPRRTGGHRHRHAGRAMHFCISLLQRDRFSVSVLELMCLLKYIPLGRYEILCCFIPDLLSLNTSYLIQMARTYHDSVSQPLRRKFTAARRSPAPTSLLLTRNS